MIKKMISAINKYNMFIGGGDVLIALSGGADSTALLLGLNEIKDKLKINLSAIHINHNIRGAEAERDQKFCVSLCQKLGVPLIVESIDVPKIAEINNESLELASRNVRYNAFEKHCKKFIVTAHTADDNCETVIYNLARGTGTKGFCGIPAVRQNILRPLIFCTRNDILDYLKNKGQDYVTDSTNLSNDYTRNKIRHNIVIPLKDINPSLLDAVSKSSVVAEEDIDFLEKYAQSLFSKYYFEKENVKFLSKNLSSEHPSIRKRILAKFYDISELCDKGLDFIHLSEMDRVLTGEIKKTSLDNHKLFKSSKLGFLIEEVVLKNEFHQELYINSGEILNSGYYLLKISNKKYDNLKKINNLLFKYSIDCDKIIGNLEIRSRRDGDKFSPVGRNLSKTIKKLLCESDLTDSEKSNLFIICDEDGIIFTNLFGIAERVKVDDNSKNIIVISNNQEIIKECDI